MYKYKNKNRLTDKRHGSASVEMIIVLPVLVIIIFGSIETCNLIYLKQTVNDAAYQGALRALKPGATESDVTNTIQTILNARDVQNYTIDVDTTGNLEDRFRGDVFEVSVTVDASSNLIGIGMLTQYGDVTSVVTAQKQ